MKTIILALTLATAVGCRDRAMTDDERPAAAKPVAHDDDFIQTRTSFETSMRERLDRLKQRIDQLEARTDAAGHDAAAKLRARTDDVATRLKQAGDVAEPGWDRYERDTTAVLDQIERDADHLVY